MRVDQFDFALPPERIARHPATPRDSARLLHVGRDGGLADHVVTDLPELLRPDDLLVVNDTKVVPCRLDGRTDSGAGVEVTLIRTPADHGDNASNANPAEAGAVREAWCRPARKLKPGGRVHFAGGMSAAVLAKAPGGTVRLGFDRDDAGLMAILAQHGRAPLPPYIPRPGDIRDDRTQQDQDRADYQTLFATHDGAVAAPTAGLHFTPSLLSRLAERGIGLARLTLHVGIGSFAPVRVADTGDHAMHGEWGRLDAATATRLNTHRDGGGRIVAVGTTSLRLLESAVGADGVLRPFCGETALFITPGYRFRLVGGLLTNFHLPRSTLFMLTAAFSGLDIMHAAYAHAIAGGYRFYSWGDACLLERAPETP